MTWYWNPFWGPVWIDSGIVEEGKNIIDIADRKEEKTRIEKGFYRKGCGEPMITRVYQQFTPTRERMSVQKNEIEPQNEITLIEPSSSTNTNDKDENLNLKDIPATATDDPSLKLINASINKQFEEISIGLFRFKSDSLKEQGQNNGLPLFIPASSSSVPTSISHYRKINTTKDGIPVYTFT